MAQDKFLQKLVSLFAEASTASGDEAPKKLSRSSAKYLFSIRFVFLRGLYLEDFGCVAEGTEVDFLAVKRYVSHSTFAICTLFCTIIRKLDSIPDLCEQPQNFVSRASYVSFSA